MFHLTVRDLLWLLVVAAVLVMAWQNFVARGALELENTALWAENRRLREVEEQRVATTPLCGLSRALQVSRAGGERALPHMPP
jgi:hypothetical protein